MEKEKFHKMACKIINFATCVLLTVFAGAFAFTALIGLFISIVQKDVVSVIGSFACGFIAWIIWNIRRDVL